MKDRIIKSVNDYCARLGVPTPPVDFDLTTRAAGTFSYGVECGVKSWGISFNLNMAAQDIELFLANTVPHEVAHYVRYVRNNYEIDLHFASGKVKKDIHGAKWVAVMRELGVVNITRFHSYKVKEAKRFEYQCECCGATYMLTAIKRNRMLKNPRHYVCRNDQKSILEVM